MLNNWTVTKGRILIVEDEAIVAMDIRSKVISLGYTVLAVSGSAEDASAKIMLEKPDLIFLDIGLKGKIDGIQFAHEIHSRWNIPFVFITGHSNKETIDKCMSTHPSGYIMKPFGDHEIYVAIELALQNKSRQSIKNSQEQNSKTPVSKNQYCVVEMDLNGNIIAANQDCKTLIGYSPNELTSLSIESLVTKEQYISLKLQNLRLLKQGQSKFMLDIKGKCGSIVKLEGEAFLMKNDCGLPFILSVGQKINVESLINNNVYCNKSILSGIETETPNISATKACLQEINECLQKC